MTISLERDFLIVIDDCFDRDGIEMAVLELLTAAAVTRIVTTDVPTAELHRWGRVKSIHQFAPAADIGCRSDPNAPCQKSGDNCCMCESHSCYRCVSEMPGSSMPK